MIVWCYALAIWHYDMTLIQEESKMIVVVVKKVKKTMTTMWSDYDSLYHWLCIGTKRHQ